MRTQQAATKAYLASFESEIQRPAAEARAAATAELTPSPVLEKARPAAWPAAVDEPALAPVAAKAEAKPAAVAEPALAPVAFKVRPAAKPQHVVSNPSFSKASSVAPFAAAAAAAVAPCDAAIPPRRCLYCCKYFTPSTFELAPSSWYSREPFWCCSSTCAYQHINAISHPRKRCDVQAPYTWQRK